MNDLIRYFRSLCIRTQWLRDPVEWMVLNTKLRHSRLLSYAALLLLLGESSCVQADKVEWLAARTRLTPMERIACVFFEHAAVEQFTRFAQCYDTFLASMDGGILCPEPGWQPTSIPDCVRHSGYQTLKTNSTELIQELLQFVLDRHSDWKARFFEYLIF